MWCGVDCTAKSFNRIDPVRRPVARKLVASKSALTAPFREACKDANFIGALLECIISGRQQAAQVPPVFGLDPEYDVGDARMYGTTESAVVGGGTLPTFSAAPFYLHAPGYPIGYARTTRTTRLVISTCMHPVEVACSWGLLVWQVHRRRDCWAHHTHVAVVSHR